MCYFLSDYCSAVQNKEGITDLLAQNAIFNICSFNKLEDTQDDDYEYV